MNKLMPEQPTTEILDRAVSFALNVKLSSTYTWSDYMRDLYATMYAASPITDTEPVIMGNNTVAVGECEDSISGMKGIVYLRLPHNSERIHGESCADIYPVGSEPPKGSILSCIYFKNDKALQQTIDILNGMKSDA